MQKTAERICSFLSKTVGETGQDRVIRKGRIAAGAPQGDFRGTAFTVPIDGHRRVNREGIVLVSPGNARLNRNSVAWTPKAHATTDCVVNRDTFDATAEGKRQPLLGQDDITEPAASKILVWDTVVLQDAWSRWVVAESGFGAILLLGREQVGTFEVTEQIPIDPLVGLEFENDSPAAIAGLDGGIYWSGHRTAGAEGSIRGLIVTGRRFETEAQRKVTFHVLARVQQPDIRDQPDISQPAGVHGMAVNEIMLVEGRSVGIDKRDRKRSAPPFANAVRGRHVKAADVIDDIVPQPLTLRLFHVPNEMAKRFVPPIRD